MPKFFNGNAHAIRIDGKRYRSGEVFEASGEAADTAEATVGVETATSEHEDAWGRQVDAEQRRSNPQGIDADAHLAATALAHRKHADRLSIAVPLNEVVGDDAAPFGPPSGTVTTKQAVIRDARSDYERSRFGPGERQPEDAENENLNGVERAQAEAKSAVEEAHNELLAQRAQAAGDGAESESSQAKPKRGARKRAESSPEPAGASS